MGAGKPVAVDPVDHFKWVFTGACILTVLAGGAAVFLTLAAPEKPAVEGLVNKFADGFLLGLGGVVGLLSGRTLK